MKTATELAEVAGSFLPEEKGYFLMQEMSAMLRQQAEQIETERMKLVAAYEALEQAIAQEQPVRRCKTCKSFTLSNSAVCRSCNEDYCNWEPKP